MRLSGSVINYLTQPFYLPCLCSPFGAFLGLCATGILIHYSLMFMLSAISFWAVRAQGIVWGYYSLFNIARYPDAVFRGVFKIVFTYFIPVIIVANVPAKTLARALESPWSGLAQLAGAAVFVVLASRWFWHFAIRRYSSASS